MQQVQQMQQMQQLQQMQQMQQKQQLQQMENILQNGLNEIEVTFHNSNGMIHKIKVAKGTKMKDLFVKYADAAYGLTFKNLVYLYNGEIISRREERKVEDIFKSNNHPVMVVVESDEYHIRKI